MERGREKNGERVRKWGSEGRGNGGVRERRARGVGA